MSDVNNKPPVVVYAGPSLFGSGIVRSADDGIQWRPPARRGDIEAMVTSFASEGKQAGTIALADGTFHSYPSVRHIELREAMRLGWSVWGLCSMGAIRVCEMKHMGMKAWGKVAERFCSDPGFADDEVALVHSSEDPWMPFSEPMIHIRQFLGEAWSSGLVNGQQQEAVLARMRNRWYGERTLANLKLALSEALGSQDGRLPQDVEAAIADFSPYRLKQADLASFIDARPWEDAPRLTTAREPNEEGELA